MKKIYFLPVLLIALFIPFSVKAYVIKSADFIYIGKDEIIEGNFYFTAKSLTVEGQILGDVIGVASNIQINGQISGDVIAISQNISINGKINGNLRSISNSLNINGVIDKNLNFLGDNVLLGENSIIGQDALIKTVSSEFNGEIMGNLHGGTNNSIIRGKINKNINLTIDSWKKKKYFNLLEIDESAIVSGSIIYKSGQDALIKTENISGEIIKQEPVSTSHKKSKTNKLFYAILSGFLIAIILNKIIKKQTQNLKNIILKKNYKVIGYGAIILFLTPIAAILAMITVIGIPIALISLMMWGILIYLSKIFIAIAVGDYFFKLIKKEEFSSYLKILSGIIIVCLLFALPYIGWIFSLLAILIGLGSIYYKIKNKNHVN